MFYARQLFLMLVLLDVLLSPGSSQSCVSRALGRRFPSGARWTEPGCTQMSCRRGLVQGRGCAIASYPPGSGCVKVQGEPDAEYPDCCDRVKCPRPDQCFSIRLNKTFDDGEEWTERPCALYTCKRGTSEGQGCPMYHVRPGCKTEKGTPGTAYPQCCDKQSCPAPDQCYSQRLDKVFDNGEEWTEPPCQLYKCNNGYAEGIQCPIYQYSRCVRKEGTPGAKYPNCCAAISCPKPDQCYSDRLKKIFNNNQTWTEPSCGRFRCHNGRTEVTSCPDLTIGRGCVKLDGSPDAPYPACCPTVSCPRTDQCHSDRLGKTYDSGQTWTEPPCVGFTCANGTSNQRDCPAVRVTPGCVKESGTTGAQFPSCCPKVTCRSAGQCYSASLRKTFNDGDTWTEHPCASYTCNNGTTKLKTCPVAVRWDGCELVKGKVNASFPECCDKQKCPDSSQCFSRVLRKTFDDGEKWTEPPCLEKTCSGGFINSKECPWSAGFGCKREPGTPGAKYPKCCDKFKCDDFASLDI
ncbi:extracellular matrix organizing protein FRAS1-like [Amphibalanus amphitrite]|uniref:extracellular matrix organizing protein FRAS1-like n=1 Tax=Amphibalanus amphitrite TaxID=1232801 RepID=UPI001C907411|nr:extracellular matrix organizing protein FRAS1-like [Amphibalanus amphitrite]